MDMSGLSERRCIRNSAILDTRSENVLNGMSNGALTYWEAVPTRIGPSGVGRGRTGSAPRAAQPWFGLMDLLPLLPQALADGLLLGGAPCHYRGWLTMTFGVLRIANVNRDLSSQLWPKFDVPERDVSVKDLYIACCCRCYADRRPYL